ncbi:hypothetical protein N0V84_000749 [Fusarium piperis]|uniref:LysM domain-containing protein n=1 Tax=Fusarium piperis TaxID=1435070 RepID=A0A9W9BUW4_9HYPO|nr:hypothetical protein N0V84_000749 [Fusarium piperis]
MPEKCQVYTVEEGDLCIEIVWSVPNDITISQLVAWNPNLNPTCSNMYQQEGMQICVSPPGDDPSKLSNSGIKGPATPAPQPGNMANGTNTRCGKYHNVTSGESCKDIVGKFISFKHFYFPNAGVISYCTNLLLGYGPTRLPETTSTSTYETLQLTPPATLRNGGKWVLTGGKNPNVPTTTTNEVPLRHFRWPREPTTRLDA